MEEINYKELLIKYREHVEYCEGIDFVGAMSTYESEFGAVRFTKEEIEFMESLSSESSG